MPDDTAAGRVDPSVDLHVVEIDHAAPTLLTPGAFKSPLDDISTLYRMSTGVFGRRTGWGFNRPFPYARPYMRRVEFGSPLVVEIIVPTVLLGGPTAFFGLPRLLDLLQNVWVAPSDVRRRRAENIAARKEAEVRTRYAEGQLLMPGLLEDAAEAALRRDVARAEADEAHAEAERAEVLDRLPQETRDAVTERYGRPGVQALEGIARRSNYGPVQATDLDVRPVDNPEALPQPPRELPKG